MHPNLEAKAASGENSEPTAEPETDSESEAESRSEAKSNKQGPTESSVEECDADHALPPLGRTNIGLKVLGLLITMLALSQGAPFWFDTLNRVVNLRLAGDAPDEKKKP